MFIARFNILQKIFLGIIIFALVLGVAFFVGYRFNNYKKTNTNVGKTESQAEIEAKILRSQEEITISYKQNMERTISRLKEIDNKEEMILVSENSFFDIFVPTDLRDIHLQKMLEVQKLSEQENLEVEDLKGRVISIINELLSTNKKLMENIE